MAIPSYDDLTPSIPDVSPGDVLNSVAAVLPRPGSRKLANGARDSGLGAGEDLGSPKSSFDPRGPSPDPRVQGFFSPCDPGELYAALHEADGAAIDRLMAIAGEFSPRIGRYPVARSCSMCPACSG